METNERVCATAPGMPVAAHLRENFERTDEVLQRVAGLVDALVTIAMDHPGTAADDPARRAQATLLGLLGDMVEDLPKLRAAEWAGIGGNTVMLTPDEIAAARGE